MRNLIALAWLFVLFTASVACASEVTVTQEKQKFSQSSLTVKAGDTVVIQNKDIVNHNINVVNAEGDSEDKGLQRPNETIKVPFPKSGKYQLLCTIHPDMVIDVTVQ
jgi:plastocyanin